MKQIRDIEQAYFLDDAYWQHVDRKHGRRIRLENRVAKHRGRRYAKLWEPRNSNKWLENCDDTNLLDEGS